MGRRHATGICFVAFATLFVACDRRPSAESTEVKPEPGARVVPVATASAAPLKPVALTGCKVPPRPADAGADRAKVVVPAHGTIFEMVADGDDLWFVDSRESPEGARVVHLRPDGSTEVVGRDDNQVFSLLVDHAHVFALTPRGIFRIDKRAPHAKKQISKETRFVPIAFDGVGVAFEVVSEENIDLRARSARGKVMHVDKDGGNLGPVPDIDGHTPAIVDRRVLPLTPLLLATRDEGPPPLGLPKPAYGIARLDGDWIGYRTEHGAARADLRTGRGELVVDGLEKPSEVALHAGKLYAAFDRGLLEADLPPTRDGCRWIWSGSSLMGAYAFTATSAYLALTDDGHQTYRLVRVPLAP